jgi:hypothetical protein
VGVFVPRAVLLASALVAFRAPLQCSGEPPPEARRYETPPDALYDLAARFKKGGDRHAYRETLTYLVERYPNSRFALQAREELRNDGGGE